MPSPPVSLPPSKGISNDIATSFKSARNEPNKSDISSTELIGIRPERSFYGANPFQFDGSTGKASPQLLGENKTISTDTFAPFQLKRVYGRLTDIPVISLTGIHKSHILYAASNAVILFDFFTNTQQCLQGHKNLITTVVRENDLRFFASADSGDDSLLIIWDLWTMKPIKSFINPHDDYGVVHAAFTGIENTLATIGAEDSGRQRIFFWNFDPAQPKEPLCVGYVPEDVGFQREIAFCDEKPEYFATTGDYYIVFYTWLRNDKSSVYIHKPKIPAKFMVRMKRFTSSLWMRKQQWLLTGTMLGYGLIWDSPLILGLQEPPDPTKNIKEYKRCFKISDHGITCLTKYKEFIIAGDEKGVLRFFDSEFRIVRWTKNFQLPAIRCVSFNVTDKTPEFLVGMQGKYDTSTKNHVHREKNSFVKDYTFGGRKNKILSQTTIEREHLPLPDFIIGLENGNVYYFHFAESKIDLLVHGAPGRFVAMDVCPKSPHVVFTTAIGEIQMYDYNTHKLIFDGKIFKKAIKITTMKFHPNGTFVFFGTDVGQVYYRRNYTWASMSSPLAFTTDRIKRIIFTSDGLHMSHYDSEGLIVLYKYHIRKKHWVYRGKCRAHVLEIVDFHFVVDSITFRNRLFSLGADRRLIEYDLVNCNSDQGLKVIKITQIEESSSPTSMVFVAPSEFGNTCMMIHSKLNKFRIYDYQKEKVMKTCTGPLFGGEEIKRLLAFSPTASILENGVPRKFILFFVGNKLGLITTPVDGNPHRYMALLAHPGSILDVCVAETQKQIFTIGEKDSAAFMFEPTAYSAEAAVLMGGSGITPFVHVLNRYWPGQDIMKDIELTFFHLNLKRIETQSEMISMQQTIKLAEIAAVCRSCGFYPSEHEIDMMLAEVTFMLTLRSGDLLKEITIEDFVKLFANHFYRVTDEEIEWAFKTLGEYDDNEEVFISRDMFLYYMCGKGEPLYENSIEELFKDLYKKTLNTPVVKESINNQDEFAKLTNGLPKEDSEADEQGIEEQGTYNPTSKVDFTSSNKLAVEPDDEGNKLVEGKAEDVFGKEVGNVEDIVELGVIKSMTEVFEPDKPKFRNDLPVEIRIDAFIQKMLPHDCQRTITWDEKSKEEDKNLENFFIDKTDLHPWNDSTGRFQTRERQRLLRRKIQDIADPRSSFKDRLLSAFETEYFVQTGHMPERNELQNGAQAFLSKNKEADTSKRKLMDTYGYQESEVVNDSTLLTGHTETTISGEKPVHIHYKGEHYGEFEDDVSYNEEEDVTRQNEEDISSYDEEEDVTSHNEEEVDVSSYNEEEVDVSSYNEEEVDVSSYNKEETAEEEESTVRDNHGTEEEGETEAEHMAQSYDEEGEGANYDEVGVMDGTEYFQEEEAIDLEEAAVIALNEEELVTRGPEDDVTWKLEELEDTRDLKEDTEELQDKVTLELTEEASKGEELENEAPHSMQRKTE